MEFLKIEPAESLLDVGCGTGFFSDLAFKKGADVTGLDAIEQFNEHAKQRNPSINFIVGEMEELPYADSIFNFVCGLNSFQYAASLRIAYVYWKNGINQKAETYFNKTLEYNNWLIEMGYLKTWHHLLFLENAGVYAYRVEKQKAYEYLNKFNQREIMSHWENMQLKEDPLFDSIRDEPEFQQIVHDVEAKYQADHERVRQWPAENEML